MIPQAPGERSLSYKFAHCLRMVFVTVLGIMHAFQGRGFSDGVFPRGNLSWGEKLRRNELVRGNYPLTEFAKFLYLIIFVCLAFSLPSQFYA